MQQGSAGTRRLSRVAGFVYRFALARESLGIYGAVRVTLLDRFSASVRRLRVPAADRDFWYRSWADGVVTHLFQPGYRIVAPDHHRVKRILDGGANIGDETLRFRAHHPEADIIAVEPEPGNFSLLERNFIDDPAIHLVRAGLWSSETKLRITEGDQNVSFRVEEVGAGEPYDVDAVSIPSLLERFGWDSIDILKLDVEGAEYEIFSSGTEGWLPRVGALIFECPDRDRPGAAMAIFRAAVALDWRVYLSGENVVMIRSDRPWDLQQVLGIGPVPT